VKSIKLSHAAAASSSSKRDGACHVRYGHKSWPTVIDIACPKCSLRAVVSFVSPKVFGAFVGDGYLSTFGDRWAVACTQCTYRTSSMSGVDVTPFYWEFDAAGCRVWAWNIDHFKFLWNVLVGQKTHGDPHEWFRAYIRREWLLKRNRLRIAKEIATRIANQPVQRTGASRSNRMRNRTKSAAGTRR